MRRLGRRRATVQPGTFASLVRGMGAVSHLDPSWGATDNGTTSTWTDRILSGHVLQSASAATRLQYSASLAGLNGRPGWTGVQANNTHLTSTGNQLASLLSGTTAHTTYVVRRVNIASIPLSIGNSGSPPDYIYFGALNLARATTYVRKDNGGQTANVSQTLGTAGVLYINSFVFTGSAISAFDNGAALTLNVTANTKSLTINRTCAGGLLIGGSITAASSLDGDLGDIITFLGAHTQAQRWAVEALIARKYGVAVTRA